MSRMSRVVLAIFAWMLFSPSISPSIASSDDGSQKAGDDDLQKAMADDVILRAMVDELARNHAGLHLEDFEQPYFIEYALGDGIFFRASATLGAITRRQIQRTRPFRSDVRVGSYELDNTNFRSSGSWSSGDGGADMPIENDYLAIRQAIWWTSDADYKTVCEDLVRKKAFMQSKLIEDKPDDLSRVEPTVYLEERAPLAVDGDALTQIATEVSAVFREFPDVLSSSVSATASAGNLYVANTEGTRLRTRVAECTVSVRATVQADDGMMLGDALMYPAHHVNDLPPASKMMADVRQMVQRLLQVRDAPTLDAYTGPVLYDPEPAALTFARNFAARFAGGQRNVGSRTSPNDFANKINQRILPRSVSVVDDPTRETFNGAPAFGHYLYDIQGVRGQPVTLVEKGKLVGLLMSRNPSKDFPKSNGHGRGFFRPQAGVGNLIVTTDKPIDSNGLRSELLEACAEEGLDYGIRIAALGRAGGSNPLVVYKIFPDGRDELIRGIEVSGLDLRAFKHILALGDKPHVLNATGGLAGTSRTAVVPAMLFEELDLSKIDRDFNRPPILPSPLARKSKP